MKVDWHRWTTWFIINIVLYLAIDLMTDTFSFKNVIFDLVLATFIAFIITGKNGN